MYGIDSGNGYVYGEDPAVEQKQMKEEQSEKEEKSNGLDKFSNYN